MATKQIGLDYHALGLLGRYFHILRSECFMEEEVVTAWDATEGSGVLRTKMSSLDLMHISFAGLTR